MWTLLSLVRCDQHSIRRITENSVYMHLYNIYEQSKILNVQHVQQTLLGRSPPRSPEPKLLKFKIVVDTILSIASAVKNAW